MKKFRCAELSRDALYSVKQKVFATQDRQKQNVVLSQFLHVRAPKRPKKGFNEKVRAVTVNYEVPLRNEKERVPVCSKFFQSIFEVKARRILTIARGMQSGNGFEDKRGGTRERPGYAEKREAVRVFIQNLKASESHYGREKSRRIYLSSEWNINRLHKKYNEDVQEHLNVGYHFFYGIFVKDFNIGFGTPASDTCGVCERYYSERKIAQEAKDAATARKLRRAFKLHRAKSKAFYHSMRRDLPNSVSLCFDLQQVQYLPKLTIGETFYKRQLPFYSFCVVPPGKNTEATFFTWNATEGHRGAEEIVSALLHYMDSKKNEWPTGLKHLYLYCDGCGGQNKNRHMIHALAFWLANSTLEHLKCIELVFPVRGHSYLPADRVFGRVEKQMRRIKEVLLPSDYNKIYREHGEVREVNTHWKIRQFKVLAQYMNACSGIQEAKRVVIKKLGNESEVGFKFEINYFQNDKSKKFTPIMKGRHKLSMLILPATCNNDGPLQLEKKLQADLQYLMLRRFGENWRIHHPFYANIIEKDAGPSILDRAADEIDNPADGSSVWCNCIEGDDLLL